MEGIQHSEASKNASPMQIQVQNAELERLKKELAQARAAEATWAWLYFASVGMYPDDLRRGPFGDCCSI